MIAFVIRRVLHAVGVLLATLLVAFAALQILGAPVEGVLDQQATAEQRLQLSDQLGPEDPVLVQFLRFVVNAAQGDVGRSYQMGRPASELILEGSAATFALLTASALIAASLGVGLVLVGRVRRDGAATLLGPLALIGASAPAVMLGGLLIYVVSPPLGGPASFDSGESGDLLGWRVGLAGGAALSAVLLPAIALGLCQAAIILRWARAETIDVMSRDHIGFARVRGLSDRAVVFGHALRNVLAAAMAAAGPRIGVIMTCGIVTEGVFQWPGLGFLFVRAVETGDAPVMAAVVLVTGALIAAINLAVDLARCAIDPRVRAIRGSEAA